MDGIDNYSCNCKAGYSGDHCEAGKFVVNMLNKFKFANELMMMLPVSRVAKFMISLLEVPFNSLIVSYHGESFSGLKHGTVSWRKCVLYTL